MSDIIKLLPDSVANQIAAGEVIQRPSSVVKELVENAVDAGATKISVIIRDAGRTLIQIIDNGSGMSVTDARLAFERHSTSKIKQANDLFSLNTMGFRGEALASIAAVAQVEMKTMRANDSIGTQLIINGSNVESQTPVATIQGTNMMVKNLFFNVPARRKFLKKDVVEMNNILHEFERLALVNPDIELSLIHNDTVIHQLNKHSLKKRIGALFGQAVETKIIPVGTQTSIVTINGFIGLPQNARKRGALQYLFVNGRNMRHPYFHKAILSCYEQLIRPDEQPNYFIDFKVDPATIDVNIHPTKNEIKFENEQYIWQILVAAVKESLGKFNAAPAIDFKQDPDLPEIPAFGSISVQSMPSVETDPNYNPFRSEPHIKSKSVASSDRQWQSAKKSSIDDWEKLYQQFIQPQNGDKDSETSSTNDLTFKRDDNDSAQDMFEGTEEKIATSIIQCKNKYLLTQNRAGILIIDQHRAHVKILFEEIITKIEHEKIPSQQLIFPEIIELMPSENAVLNSALSEIEHFGFELSYLGDNQWSINGIPGLVNINSPVQLLHEIIISLGEEQDDVSSRIFQRIALGLARAGAIRAGQTLSDAEMQNLISRLLSLPSPLYTPDGLNTMADISVENLDSLFK